VTEGRYALQLTPTVKRQLAEQLPEAVAAAAFEFITGPLLENPHRVGRPLSPPLDDRYGARRGTYRVVYRIEELSRTVVVLLAAHRRDAYRPG
jgi:mRNA interferase RelE/StbE